MTTRRSELVDVEVTPWYHVISKTVRGAHLLGQGQTDRKQWLEDRMQELAGIFAVDVAGFSVLDNHLHLLVRLSPEVATDWSDEEVVRRWGRLFPPRGKKRKPFAVTKHWIRQQLKDKKRVRTMRERLSQLGWFMKCLKEPLARLANREDGCKGAFWQGRYKSIAILDEAALLAACTYIDLNPLAAGLAQLPEESAHTSLRLRVEHCRQQGHLEALNSARDGSTIATGVAGSMEQGLWLCPVEDGQGRVGLLEGFTLASYLLLIDWTSRLLRHGKAALSQKAPSILERLGADAPLWDTVMSKLFECGEVLGVAFAFQRIRLQEAAVKRGRHHVANLNGCVTRDD